MTSDSSEGTLADPAQDVTAVREEQKAEGAVPTVLAEPDTTRMPRHAVSAPAGPDPTLKMRRKWTSVRFSQRDLPALEELRARRHMTGLFYLNARPDLIDAGHHIPSEEEKAAGKGPDPNVIIFEGPDDPLNPQNWSFARKAYQTGLLGISTLVVTYASSVFSTATLVIASRFRVSTEVATFGTSCFLLGYVVGPCLWGPSSEFLGRKFPILLTFVLFAIFTIPVAVAQNLETIFLGRFLQGLFAAGPLTIVPGALADYCSPETRGVAMTVYAVAAAGGPAVGPLMGDFITYSKLEWRWTMYITMIWAWLMIVIILFTMKESFGPLLLQKKAAKIKFETKNWAVRSKLDEKQFSFKDLVHTYLLRPFQMLFFEPVLLITTIYSSFVYGILYLLFGAVPYVFEQQRGFKPGTTGLVFIAVFVGALSGGFIIYLFTNRYNRVLHERKAISVPEERCLPMIVGGVVFPIGFFLFGWTSPEYVGTPWPEIVGIYFVGMGFLLVFLSAINLIVDAYLFQANSAIAANTMVRSAFAAGFPLFGTIMYRNEGTQWASTLLGCLAVAFAPIPIVFYHYIGPLLERSKYAPKIPQAPKADKPEKVEEADGVAEEKKETA